MKILPQRDPNLLQIRTGGGCLMLFGLPFLGVGLGVMAVPFFQGQPAEAIAMIPFGLIFALVGGAMVVGRGGIDVDLRRREVIRWWSAIVRVRSRVYPMAEVRQVAVTREIRKQKNSSTTVYPVYLDTAGRVNLVEGQDYQWSRRVAESIARMVGVPLSDSSSGAEVVRLPDELNECMRDRARRLGERVEAPSPPPVSALKVRQEAEGLAIELPKSGKVIRAILPLIVYGCVVAFFILPAALIMSGESTMPFGLKMLFGAVFGLLFGLLPLLGILFNLIKQLSYRVRVVVDGRKLRVEELYSGSKKVTEILAEELEELTVTVAEPNLRETEAIRKLGQNQFQVRLVTGIMRLNKSSGITARSDKASITFGENLESADQFYLYQLVRSSIIG